MKEEMLKKAQEITEADERAVKNAKDNEAKLNFMRRGWGEDNTELN